MARPHPPARGNCATPRRVRGHEGRRDTAHSSVPTGAWTPVIPCPAAQERSSSRLLSSVLPLPFLLTPSPPWRPLCAAMPGAVTVSP